jgi:DNA-binding CsgD family transcriptional regulator
VKGEAAAVRETAALRADRRPLTPRPERRGPELVGRRDLLAAARRGLASGPGVLLCGPAGIGKSALLTAIADEARARHAERGGAPATTLRCAPGDGDARWPYGGLIDLFAAVPPDVLDGLPPQPAGALRAALLRGTEPADDRGGLAVRVAVTETLRRLARRGPVLLELDDLQWLDEPSAAVLAFALRRLADAPVTVVAAERVEPGAQPLRLDCCPPRTAELAVGPLTGDDIARLLESTLGRLTPVQQRVVARTAAGNPYYALELGRAALRGGPPREDFPGDLERPAVPPKLRAAVLDRYRALPPGLQRALLVGAAADRPTLTLLRAAGFADAVDHLVEADRLAVAAAGPDGAIRFAHPLLRAAVYADASGAARREAHALLAGVVAEPVERARHLALAHPHEDEPTAAGLMAAAEEVRRRGTPEVAAKLATLAARRTPAARPVERADRWLAAAEFACDAGAREEAGRIARGVLAGSDLARQRVLARLVLLRNAGQALDGLGPLIADGLHDADGDPELEARLHQWAAVRGLLCGELDSAARHARLSGRRASVAGDTPAWLGALSVLARVRSLAGETAEAERALEQALALAGDGRGGPESWTLLRMRALLALDCDRVAEAREQVTRLLGDIGEFAGVEEVVATLVALTRIQIRSGDCRQAARTAARLARIVAGTGDESAPALYAMALAATYGGPPQAARELAERAVRASEADGDRLFLVRALAVLGQGWLLPGDPRGAARAVEVLRRVIEIGERMCAADPPMLHWYGDLAEALVMLGESDAAAEVVREAYRRAPERVPGSVSASLERADGLREAAAGRAPAGVERLMSSVRRLRALELPVELVRSLIALGAVERRARHRSAARQALAEALEVAERAGAVPLAARARAELTRLEANRPGDEPRLTPTEARIAELVSGGATNREVAAKLFISVKTVEGTLSRVYRKLGVRSRTALALSLTRPAPLSA